MIIEIGYMMPIIYIHTPAAIPYQLLQKEQTETNLTALARRIDTVSCLCHNFPGGLASCTCSLELAFKSEQYW